MPFQNCAPFETAAPTISSSASDLDAAGQAARFASAKKVIEKNCTACHYAGAPGGSLLYNTEAEYIDAKLISAGSLSASKLITRLHNYTAPIAGRNMPPTGPIADADFAALTAWVSSMPIENVVDVYTCSANEPAAPLDARRLSKSEMRRSLHRILSRPFGSTEADQILNGTAGDIIGRIPNDSRVPFSRSDRSFESGHADAYFDLAEELATSLTGTARYSRLVTTYVNYAPAACTALNVNTLTNACRDAFINNFLLRLWGRPLESGSGELAAYQAEFGNGLTSVQAVNNFLFRAFLSPQFLNHIYTDVNPIAGGEAVLSPYAIARRLSYHFQLASPDEQLLQLAAASNISQDAGYAAALNAVSQSPNVMIQDFVDDWLRLYSISSITTPNTAKWTRISSGITVDGNMRTAMRQEIIDFANYLFQGGRPVRELLTSNVSTARHPDLMRVYGQSTAAPTTFNETNAVRLPASQRAGIATRAGYLYHAGDSERPVIRGLHVMGDFLCTEVKGQAPSGASSTPLPAGLLTTREKYEQITSGGACIGCHAQMNPVGNAFANYNPFGGFQANEPIFVDGVYRQDLPVNSMVNLQAAVQESVEVQGGVAFSQWMASSTHFRACFAKKYQTYTQRLATMPTTRSSCDMQRMSEIIRNNGSLSDFLRAPAADPRFRRRTLVQ